MKTQRAGGVTTLELDHPPVNALGLDLVTAIRDAVVKADGDAETRALLIRGAGGRFAAGADIREARDMSAQQFRAYMRVIHDTFDLLEGLSMPTVAAIEGFAVGGGLELALCCDVRIMAESAKVGLPELRLGLLPGAGGIQRLLPLVGKGRLLELIYSARLVDASEAHGLRIAEMILSETEFSERCEQFVRDLAMGPSRAQAAVKNSVLAARNEGYLAAKRIELETVVDIFTTSEAREGIDAFLSKREPRFVDSAGAGSLSDDFDV